MLGFVLGGSAVAGPPLAIEQAPIRAANVRISGYLAPNEFNTFHLPPLVGKAARGAYVAVGTERGFIGAALDPQATHLVLVDHEPATVLYNRINTALLALSDTGDRADYWRLRMTASRQDWIDAAQARHLPPEMTALLSDPQTWDWWRATARSEGTAEYPTNWRYFYHDQWRPEAEREPFRRSVYWNDDTLFARIQKMAKEGNIYSVPLDLGDTAKVKDLVGALDRAHVKVSVLDLSNAWQRRYLWRSAAKRLVAAVGKVADPDSVLLLSDGEGLRGLLQMRAGGPTDWPFIYRAYTYHFIDQNGGVPFSNPASFYPSRNTLLDTPIRPLRSCWQWLAGLAH